MVKAINVAAIAEATGKSWREWCSLLDKAKASELTHAGIVAKARELGVGSGWWAQSVAVAYEQHIGRRKPGQSNTGEFSASVSRTLALETEAAFKTWSAMMRGRMQIVGLRLRNEPSSSTTPKRRYWRCKFGGGSNAVVSFEAKGTGKALVALEHANLTSESAIERYKARWTAEFEQLKQRAISE